MEEELKRKKEELFTKLNILSESFNDIKDLPTTENTSEIEMREELLKSFLELNDFLNDFIKNNEEINGEE